MYKVVYFDEDSAGDYLNISNKGVTKENTEKSINKQTARSLDIKTRLSLIFPAATIIAITSALALNNSILRFFFGIIGSIASITPITLDFLYKQNREDKELVSTQVTSTILSQFLEKQKEDGQILCIRPTHVHIAKDSFAFIKFYAPVVEMIKTTSEGIDISKFGEVMKETKGYYELIAKVIEGQSKEKTYIIRLNAESFRNNYKLTDLLHMNLTYYGIKVGKMSPDKMEFQHTFNITENSSITAHQAFLEIEQGKDALETKNGNNQSDVIDIILAGVREYEKS